MTPDQIDLPRIPVHFVYLDDEPEHDREFDALCHFVPRVGETVHAERGSIEFTIVDAVGYRFLRGPAGAWRQITTVILRSPKPGEHFPARVIVCTPPQ